MEKKWFTGVFSKFNVIFFNGAEFLCDFANKNNLGPGEIQVVHYEPEQHISFMYFSEKEIKIEN